MIKDVALVSVFFDYPEYSLPLIYDNSLKYFNEKDIYIGRFSGLPLEATYYEKLYKYKTVYLLDFLNRNIKNNYTYMIFVDAKDTNFYRDPSDIIVEFLKFNKSIVFNGERELWPPSHSMHLYSQKSTTGPFKYLNSGGYIGYTESIIEHLQNIADKKNFEIPDDQNAWALEYLYNNDIEIDSEGKIFFSTHLNKEYVDIVDDKNIIKDINPYIIHDNGPYGDNTIKFTHLL